MSEPRKNHLDIDGGQAKDEEHGGSYKPIPEADTEFRSSKASLHKSKEKVDEAEEKLLEKEDEAKIVTRVDMADAKFVNEHRNGDAKIELDANKRQFSGLTKEELMKYADDPFWVRLRWAMFVLFWALWLCMLAGAIIIIVKAPKCAPPPPKEWYQEQPLIEAADVELSEVESDLELFKDFKVGGVFVKTECGADAYEVLNTPTCLDTFKEFVKKAENHGIKVIANLIANYVPTTNEWFTKSENRTPGYETHFIWRGPKDYAGTVPKMPNHWVAVTNEPAWQYSSTRQEFYLSQYGAGKADLNFTNPDVVRQFDDVLKKWMEAGAAGVRLSHARQLLVSESFREEQARFPSDPLPPGALPAASDYHFYRHNFTSDQPGLDSLLAHFSQLVDDSAKEKGANKTVFTLCEDSAWAEWYTLRNSSALRPPAAAPLPAAALATLHKKLGGWPAIQLTPPAESADSGDDVAAFAYLLPATPVLTADQLRLFNNTPKLELQHLLSLRSEASVQHGQLRLAAVPAHDSNDSLFAVARWKPGHTGYGAVLNTLPSMLRANLTSISVLPSTVSVHFVAHDVAQHNNYTNNKEIPVDDVLVPAYSSVVFSFVAKAAAEQ